MSNPNGDIQQKTVLASQLAYAELSKMPQYKFNPAPQNVINNEINKFMKLSLAELQKRVKSLPNLLAGAGQNRDLYDILGFTPAQRKQAEANNQVNAQHIREILDPKSRGKSKSIHNNTSMMGAPLKLSDKELQTFASETLYNMLKNASDMIHKYHDSIGYISGDAAWQGFKAIGNLVSFGHVETIWKEMDKIDGLLADTIRLKYSDNKREFERIYKEFTGVNFNPQAVQKYVNLVQKGVSTENKEYQNSVKVAFGKDYSAETMKSVEGQKTKGTVMDIVMMIAGTEALSGTKLLAGFARSAIAGLGKVAGSALVGGTTMAAWTAGTGLINNATKAAPTTKEDYTNVAKSTAENFGIGAFGGLLNSTVVEKVVKLVSKGESQAIGKAIGMLSTSGETSGSDFMSTYISAAKPGLLGKAAGFATEITGFTAYSIAEKTVKSLATGQQILPKNASFDDVCKYVGQEFKGQVKSLGELKVIAKLVMMMKGGRIANSALSSMTGDLSNYQIKKVGREYEISSADGKKFKTSNPDKIVGILYAAMLKPVKGVKNEKSVNKSSGQPVESDVKKFQGPSSTPKPSSENLKDIKLITPKLTPEQLSKKGSDLVYDKNGEKELTQEADKLVWDASYGINANAKTVEPLIRQAMLDAGLANDKTLSNRSKDPQSVHDKIRTAILENPSMSLEQAIRDVRDAVGVRTENQPTKPANSPEVQAFLKKGDIKSAHNKAIEIESNYVLEGLKKIIDAQANGSSDILLSRISNYIGEDGLSYFTEHQLNELKTYAAEKKVPIHIINRVLDPADRASYDQVYNDKSTTKVRGSGYTALQMNFVTKSGDVFEWQFRGDKVNQFGEAEHVPYDLREGKDIIGKHTELTPLYEPMKKVLSKENMSKEKYKEYNAYLTAHYKYLRLVELGFEKPGNPPKLPAMFDARLRAENLELLHDVSDALKKGKITQEQAVKQYNDKLIKNTDKNTTEMSYKNALDAVVKNKSIDSYEADKRLTNNNRPKSFIDPVAVQKACRDKLGNIKDNLLRFAELLQDNKFDDKVIAGFIDKLKQDDGTIDTSVIKYLNEASNLTRKPNDQKPITEEGLGMILNIYKQTNNKVITEEAFASNLLAKKINPDVYSEHK